MAQNITNDPAFKKKLEQMTPQMPRLNPETVEFPTLDAIAQQTAREVGATPPPLSGEVEFPGLNQIGRETEMLVNAQQATQPIDPNSLEAIRAAGQARMDYSQAQAPAQDGRITSAAGLSDFMAGLNEQAGLPRTQAPKMATPESVAGLSITGTPLTQGAITSPQVPQPQVPQVGGGTITKGGETFTTQGFGQQVSDVTGQAPAAQGTPADVQAIQQREAQIAQRVAGLTPEERAREIAMSDAAASRAQIRGEEAQGLFRPSEAQIQQAQTEAVARQADYEQRQVNNRIDSQMRQWERDNPRATEEATAMQRQQLIQQEALVEKPDATKAGGLTFEQQLALSKEQRAGRQEARDVAEAQATAQATQQEAFDTSLTNVRATQDAFNKLEPVAREIATLSGSVFTEGALGWAASKLPMSTDSKQIERLAKELEGTTFLQGLIEAKAKGATFGALSEREGDRILAARGKLIAPDSTNRQRISAVNDMMNTIQTSMERARSDHESKYGKSEETAAPTTTRGVTYSDNSNYEII